MTTVLLFHHALGQTTGFLAFADGLRAAGHTVHVPDLYEGKTFGDIDEGVAYARQVGFDEIIRRGAAAAEDLPADIVDAGFSLGVLPAQSLAQTRPGARGAIFFHACMPPSEFGGPWPEGVPLQIHMMEADPWGEEDRPAAEALVEDVEDAELFLYPGVGPPVRRRELGRLRRAGGRTAHGAHARRPGPGRVAGVQDRHRENTQLTDLELSTAWWDELHTDLSADGPPGLFDLPGRSERGLAQVRVQWGGDRVRRGGELAIPCSVARRRHAHRDALTSRRQGATHEPRSQVQAP